MVTKKDLLKNVEKFNSKLILLDDSSCTTFDGYINVNGYVEFQFRFEGKKKNILAHRASYIINNNEELKTEDVIMHSCDNPKCVNPDHLIKSTHFDNVQDRVLKNRSAIGVVNGRSKLTEEQVISIFKSSDSNKNICIKYNVTRKTIYNIKNRNTWGHLTKRIVQV